MRKIEPMSQCKEILENKIIFGDVNSPIVCKIFTLDLRNKEIIESDENYLLCNSRTDIQLISKDSFYNWLGKIYSNLKDGLDFSGPYFKCHKRIKKFGKKINEIDDNKTIDLQITASKTKSVENNNDNTVTAKTISISDNLELVNCKTLKVCVLYCNSYSAPIIKIKSLYQYKKDLKRNDFGFDIFNLSEDKLKYNSHFSKVKMEEKIIKKSSYDDFAPYTIDKMVADCKYSIRDEYILLNDDGTVDTYLNRNTHILKEKGKTYYRNCIISPLITDTTKKTLIKEEKSKMHEKEFTFKLFLVGSLVIDGKISYDYTVLNLVVLNNDNNHITSNLYLYLYKDKLYFVQIDLEEGKSINQYHHIYNFYNFIDFSANYSQLNLNNVYYDINCSKKYDLFCYSAYDNSADNCRMDISLMNIENSVDNFRYSASPLESIYTDPYSAFIFDKSTKEFEKFKSNFYTKDTLYIRDKFGIPLYPASNLKNIKGEI